VTAGDAAASVVSDPAAIAYVGFGNFEQGLKVLSIDGVTPSQESARDGSYSLVRPLLLLTGPLSQPLAQLFIDFALGTEGQAVVEQNGWIPAR
jgi:phosphate transport system substrate-binding protein